MRWRASMAPAIATMRIETTPSRRSINTDATASTPPTPSFDSPYTRTASPPMLAGRNVPTNVLTKKIRITVPSGGRRPIERRQQRPPAIGHQHAIDRDQRAREQNESPVGAAGRLPHRSRIALPEQQGSQSDRDHDADAWANGPFRRPRRSGSRWITAVIC